MRRALLLAVLSVSWTLGARAQDIPVAVAGPFSGPLAALGEQLKRGAETFVADTNGKGGVLGRRLALTTADDQCDPKQAVAVANQLAGKRIAVVVGHACSNCSIPASDVYAEEGILQITPSSTNPTLTDRGPNYRNVFRAIGRDDAQGVVAGEVIAKRWRGRNVAILHDKSAYGKGLADEVKKALNRAGVTEAMYDSITAGEKDFRSLISRLKSAGVDVVYFGGYHPEAGLIVRQAREQGLAAVLVGGDALNTSEFPAIAGPAADGTLYTYAPDPRRRPENRGIVERFRAQGYDPEGYTLYTYAAFQVFGAAAERAKSLKLDDLVKVMRATTFETVVGDIAFDEKGDLRQPKFDIYVWKDGRSEVAE